MPDTEKLSIGQRLTQAKKNLRSKALLDSPNLADRANPNLEQPVDLSSFRPGTLDSGRQFIGSPSAINRLDDPFIVEKYDRVNELLSNQQPWYEQAGLLGSNL